MTIKLPVWPDDDLVGCVIDHHRAEKLQIKINEHCCHITHQYIVFMLCWNWKPLFDIEVGWCHRSSSYTQSSTLYTPFGLYASPYHRYRWLYVWAYSSHNPARYAWNVTQNHRRSSRPIVCFQININIYIEWRQAAFHWKNSESELGKQLRCLSIMLT